jgi:hypothetical protein
VSEREQRAANEPNVSSGLESLSARDLDTLWDRFEKGQREAYMRAVEGLSLDFREYRRVCELRKAQQEAQQEALARALLEGISLDPRECPRAWRPPPPAPSTPNEFQEYLAKNGWQ